MAPYKGKRVEVEIHTDTYKIRGTLFIPLAGEGGYSSRLSDFLNNSEKHFLALTSVKVEALPTVLLTARNGHRAAHVMVKEQQFCREIA
jgi:uncharacterized protein DUF6812